jgi:hypothetical protein
MIFLSNLSNGKIADYQIVVKCFCVQACMVNTKYDSLGAGVWPDHKAGIGAGLGDGTFSGYVLG